jgi:rhodanese-related sulfurtransferase
MPTTIDEILEADRARYERLTLDQAHEELASGAVLVDTRTDPQKRHHGVIPGAMRIERNVLDWRIDPASPWRDPPFVDHDVRVFVICQEGYSSSLAAASLLDLRMTRAADVIGGFDAWRDAGLPIEPHPEPHA